MAELVVRIFCDTPPLHLDALYLFGQTADNQGSEFLRAREWRHRTEAMVVPDGPAECGYPGGEAFANEVKSFYVGHVIRMPLVGDRVTNTLSEARGLVKLALELGWRDVGLCSMPLHQVRGFMRVISTTVAEDPHRKVRFWSIPGAVLPWNEVAIHSQGIQRDTRAGLLRQEIEKIERYGDFLPPAEIIAWMDSRY